MKLWSVQILRFIAAAMVVYVHAGSMVLHSTGSSGLLGRTGLVLGQCGVDLFFVISGLIIARTARGLSAWEFVKRRVQRILPLYYVASAVYAPLALSSGLAFGWREALATIFLWPATDRMTGPMLGVGWSLCFEALFYGAFAVIIWRRWLVWPILATYVGALCLKGGSPVVAFVGNPMILEFLGGVVLAYAPRFRPAVWLVPVAVAMLILHASHGVGVSGLQVNLLSGVGAWDRLLPVALPCVLLVWGALQIEARPGLMTELGDGSYAIYLFHVPIVLLLGIALSRFKSLPPDFLIALTVSIAVIVGWRIHVLFEKPLLAFLKRPTSAVPAGA